MPDSLVRFRFRGDRIHTVDIPAAGDDTLQPIFFFGIKKGGSTMLTRIVRDLVEASPYTYFELPREVFNSGLGMFQLTEDVDGAMNRKGYAYGTFRWLPENDFLPLDNDNQKILLVRDPRDIMVSLYYSDKESHALPAEGPLRDSMEKRRAYLQSVEVDEYVIEEASTILRHYLRTVQLLALPNVKVYRYRDIIYDKLSLVRDIAGYLKIPADDPIIETVAKAHDQIPKKEKAHAHIRQVHPGNYAKKLKPETIAKLDEKFGLIINAFNFNEPIPERPED